MSTEPYLDAAKAVEAVFNGASLTDALTPYATLRAARLIRHMSYGVLREYEYLNALAAALYQKPLKVKDQAIHYLVLVALFQLRYSEKKDYAIVNEAVNATSALRKPWARGLVNAILRRYLREKDSLLADLAQEVCVQYNHPAWLLGHIKAIYPAHWQTILLENQAHPPLSLRVNLQKITREAYQAQLSEAGHDSEIVPGVPSALVLETACPVEKLPHFAEGFCSVQDVSAQRAAYFLAPRTGEVILDACAAPGGKTGHLLEYAPQIDLTAIDVDPVRVEKIKENLRRIQQDARLICEDLLAYAPQAIEKFDAILLDAPCSALGVIRRHPDIKYLRDADQIADIVLHQAALLRAAWRMLKPGGRLLYATCSILPAENQQQIQAFLLTMPTASLCPLSVPGAIEAQPGVQLLPGFETGDGFYYCLLRKVGAVSSPY